MRGPLPRRPPIAAATVALAAVFGACTESGTPDLTPLEDSGRTLFDCVPDCPPSFACYDGQCYPACVPECPEGTTCQPDGRCIAQLDEGPGDGFFRNPCGGFGELDGIPGTTCGPCGTGHWLCETENRVVCADNVGLNACGVCGELPGVPGQVCGEEQRYACAPDGAMHCLPWFDANPCLGTVDLGDALPGRPCGECNAGYYVCDGTNATVCVTPEAPTGEDESSLCGCDPADSPPVPCGSDAGACERGLRFCGPDGMYGACVVAEPGDACASDDDCADPRAVCVTEAVHPYESIHDDCRADDPEHGLAEPCPRRVCRLPLGAGECSSHDDCRPTYACEAEACRPMVTRPSQEYCNGIDDDCNGRIDDDDRRTEICGSCPYNMMLIVNAEREFGRRRICVDIYEASRPDATFDDAGADGSYATSRWDVMPWSSATAGEAVSACAGAGYNAQIPGGVAERRLCVVDEWPLACNLEGYRYPYGDDYAPGTCHDQRAGSAGPRPTSSFEACGYTPPGGRFPNYDLSGNVEEWVRGPGGAMLMGGSYRDGADELTCASVREWDGTMGDWIGFRCCSATISVTEFQE